jgi:hypothetical protein
MKQLGAHPYFGNEFVRGKEPGEFHEPWLDLKDRKGGDPEEWPKDLRIREYPDRRI